MRRLAESFGVSLGWVEKISRQHRRTRRMERVEQRHGPVSRVTEVVESSLREQLRRAPDRTLAELQRELGEVQGVELSITQLWRVLQRLGLRLKKSRSMPKSKIARKVAGIVKSGGTRSRQ